MSRKLENKVSPSERCKEGVASAGLAILTSRPSYKKISQMRSTDSQGSVCMMKKEGSQQVMADSFALQSCQSEEIEPRTLTKPHINQSVM